jgi:hypothetical protein
MAKRKKETTAKRSKPRYKAKKPIKKKKIQTSTKKTSNRTYKKHFTEKKYIFVDSNSIEIESCKFVKHKTEGNFIYFSCLYQRRKKYLCPGKVRISLETWMSHKDGMGEITNPHCDTCFYISSLSSVNENSEENESLSATEKFQEAKNNVLKLLEENSDMLPIDIDKWMKDNLPIHLHLKLESIRAIRYSFKKDNPQLIDPHIYLKKDFLTTDQLPFLRAEIYTQSFHDSKNEPLNCLFWTSDFQLNRLRMVDHFYIDGTFDSVPSNFVQTINILILDPYTGETLPAAWLCLNGKSKKHYITAFQSLYNVLTEYGTKKFELSSVTLDLEPALREGFNQVFSINHRKIDYIPCLFHIKQAWFRYSQRCGLTKQEYLRDTLAIISEYGQICWTDLKDIDLLITKLNLKFDKLKTHQELIKYINSNYGNLFKEHFVNYKNIDKKYRCNSILESFHGRFNELMGKKKNIKDFVTCIKQIENDTYKKITSLDRRGVVKQEFGANFGEKFIPTSLKNQIQNDPGSIDPQKPDPQPSLSNCLGSKQPSTSTGVKNGNKRNPPQKRKASISKKQIPIKKSKTNTGTTGNKSIPSDFSMSWLKWKMNSCRYDAFISLFIFGIYNNFQCFKYSKPKTGSNKMTPFEHLISGSEKIMAGDFSHRDVIWEQFIKLNIDSNKYGSTGFVSALFKSLEKIPEFSSTYSESKTCKKCGNNSDESNLIQGPLVSCPRKRQVFLHENYLRTFNETYFCPKCKTNSYQITKKTTDDAKFLFLMDDGLKPASNPLSLELQFIAKNGKNYNLRGSINCRGSGHYNVTLVDPYFEKGKQVKGIYEHDGLGEGSIKQIDWDEAYSLNKPYIALYELN